MSPPSISVSDDVVVVDYQDVIADPSSPHSHSIADPLERAYGSSGFGILVIRNVPGFAEAKQAFLPMAHALAHLPDLERDLTDADSLYNAGWSYGKEKLGDKPDLAKGSFYFNPLTDTPGSEEDRRQYPLSYPCNLWPTDLPDFEPAAKHIGTLMKDVVVHLAKHVDAFAAAKVPHYPPNALHTAMVDTEKAKGRLLYYFPIASSSSEGSGPKEDSWIGWHNDSGFLTALAGDVYVDHTTGEPIECTDPLAGLYVLNRMDQVVQVHIPSDCMAVQMGECVQILTGGAVVATPHCVRGANVPNVARISLPIFIDTPPTFGLHMPRGSSREQVLNAGVGSSRVPPLDSRWMSDGMTFGDFLQTTFAQYYEWSK
jgi:isopenicillin N synthase-like dioxygenase